MRVSFDSNAWEKLFATDDRESETILAALSGEKISGFICETSFRIEAVPKAMRGDYFAQPAMGVQFPMSVEIKDGKPRILLMSIGPQDELHPGLPDVQAERLKTAFAAGIRLMRGGAWLGLPSPAQISQAPFAQSEYPDREQRHHFVFSLIDQRGVGKSVFDRIGGWQTERGTPVEQKKFAKACAEWADAELVAAHVGYRNDILCTNDKARGAGTSVFDSANRSWLATEFGVKFATLSELASHL